MNKAIAIIVILLSGCAIVLKNPVIVHNDKSNGDIFFHKELDETNTKETSSRKQTEVTSSVKKRVGGFGDIQDVNETLEVYDKQKSEQLKKVEKTLETDSVGSTKAKIEILRVQLIDAKIRRTLCKNNYMAIQSDTLSTDSEILESKECWEHSEDQVVKLTSQINNLKHQDK